MSLWAWLAAALAAPGCGSEAGDSDVPDAAGAGDAGADGDTRDTGDAPEAVDGADAGDPDAPVDPADLPLLALEHFEYAGALRLPAAEYGASSMNFAEGPLAYNPANHSIFVVGHSHHQAIAEFALPDLVAGESLQALQMAGAPLQAFTRVLDRADNPQVIDRVGGLALLEGPNGLELLVNGYEYYDAPADNSHTTLMVREPDDLAGSDVSGFWSLEGAAHVAGWVSPVPPEWQPELGGAFIAGSSSGIPIIGRASVGPSAFLLDPAELLEPGGSPGDVQTTALLDFDLEHPLHDDLSNDGGENDVWTHLSRAVYGFVAPGTRTYVTLGYSGGHESGVCYKCTPTNGTEECGGYCANDVDDYSHFYWLWDVADLAAVGRGEMEPWEVRPYAWGEFPAPFDSTWLGGGSYDPESGLLYLTLQRADTAQGTYDNPPVVAAWRIARPSP